MIKIYGASDDLVEVDGDVVEEFSCYDGKRFIATSSGFVASIEYSEDGEWVISPRFVPAIWKSSYKVHPAGSEIAEKLSGSDYSDVLVIDVDTDWVVFGEAMAKR